MATCEIDYNFLHQADNQRLQQHILTEVMQITTGLISVIRNQFGPELIEHLTEAFTVARQIARERNGQANFGFSEENVNPGGQTQE